MVLRREIFGKIKYFITAMEERLLVDYGFKKVGCFRSDQVDCDLYHELKPQTKKNLAFAYKELRKKCKAELKKDDDFFNYGYSVTCNQDEVIYFLLKNNISFEANCHYGDYNVVYRKNEKDFLILQNYGIQARMGDNYKEMLERTGWVQEKAIEKVNVKKWLNKEDKFRKELNDENT